MECKTVTFQGIQPRHFEGIIARAAELGAVVKSDQGVIQSWYFRFRWNYDRASQRLEIQCVEYHNYSCDVINAGIRKDMEICIASSDLRHETERYAYQLYEETGETDSRINWIRAEEAVVARHFRRKYRAFELYQARGMAPNDDLADWFRAEAEIRDLDPPGIDQSKQMLSHYRGGLLRFSEARKQLRAA